MELFPQLYGNERIKNNLAVDVANGKAAHAYIIEGPEGCGKHTLAKLICASSVCEKRGKTIPCGICPSCRKILSDNSVDVTYINRSDRATISISAIRELKESLYITPNDGEKKFYIIEEADLMTNQAQNSLLLSLEDPPEYVMFLLLTTDKTGLLETITSRAPTIRPQLFEPDEIREYLIKNNLASASQKLDEAVYLSGGSIGMAMKYYSSGTKTEDSLRMHASSLVSCLMTRGKSADSLAVISSLPSDREKVCEILSLTKTALRDIIVFKRMDEGDRRSYYLFYSSESDIPETANRITIKRIMYLCDILQQSLDTIKANGAINTILTDLCLKKDTERI